MANSSWRLLFPHGFVDVLNPYGSDHSSLVVYYFKSPTIMSKSFHFQVVWIHHLDFRNFVSQT
uniref:Uncharacterized protein n=1 Tax=Cajanus cajan TaxID=3821 RepID=A0A151TBQ6_CAJCA|nr:hypothetical protein KK1_019082 [Cajanus cajan]